MVIDVHGDHPLHLAVDVQGVQNRSRAGSANKYNVLCASTVIHYLYSKLRLLIICAQHTLPNKPVFSKDNN